MNDVNKVKDKKLLKVIFKVIKKKFKLPYLLFLAILFSTSSFAWFIYMNKISSDIDVRVKAWNVSFNFNNQTMTDYVTFDIDEIYPGMNNYSESLFVTNDGEVSATLSYEIISATILNEVYNTEDNSITSDEIKTLLNENYPFKILINSDNDVILGNGGTSNFNVSVSWPYESYDDEGNINDELDTYWGQQAYQFSSDNPDSPCIQLKVKLLATQINE